MAFERIEIEYSTDLHNPDDVIADLRCYFTVDGMPSGMITVIQTGQQTEQPRTKAKKSTLTTDQIADDVWRIFKGTYGASTARVKAIKEYRARTGASLVVAKNAIDAAAQRNP